jgi:hypothetical protein
MRRQVAIIIRIKRQMNLAHEFRYNLNVNMGNELIRDKANVSSTPWYLAIY